MKRVGRRDRRCGKFISKFVCSTAHSLLQGLIFGLLVHKSFSSHNNSCAIQKLFMIMKNKKGCDFRPTFLAQTIGKTVCMTYQNFMVTYVIVGSFEIDGVPVNALDNENAIKESK